LVGKSRQRLVPQRARVNCIALVRHDGPVQATERLVEARVCQHIIGQQAGALCLQVDLRNQLQHVVAQLAAHARLHLLFKDAGQRKGGNAQRHDNGQQGSGKQPEPQ
jgi:hypothetical protein